MSRGSFFLQVVTAILLAQGLGPLSLVPSAVPSSFQSNLYTVVKIIPLNLRNDHIISPPQKPFMTAPAYTIESKLVNMIEDPVSSSKLPSPPSPWPHLLWPTYAPDTPNDFMFSECVLHSCFWTALEVSPLFYSLSSFPLHRFCVTLSFHHIFLFIPGLVCWVSPVSLTWLWMPWGHWTR